VAFASAEVEIFWRSISDSLDKMVTLLANLTSEQLDWRPQAQAANSLGVLATHVLGQAEESIVETLSGRHVGRDRKLEFDAQGITSASIKERWEKLMPRMADTLANLRPEVLDTVFHHPRRGGSTGREILLVVSRHVAEHLGQAELTRDLLRAERPN
jgi:hypothetical protein